MAIVGWLLLDFLKKKYVFLMSNSNQFMGLFAVVFVHPTIPLRWMMHVTI